MYQLKRCVQKNVLVIRFIIRRWIDATHVLLNRVILFQVKYYIFFFFFRSSTITNIQYKNKIICTMPISTFFFCRNYKLKKQIKEQTKFRAFLLEHCLTIKRKRKQIEFLRRLDSPEFVFVSLPKQTAYYVYIIFQLFTLNAFFLSIICFFFVNPSI